MINNLNCTNDNPGLVLLKNYDEKRMKFDDKPFNSSTFEDWVNIFSKPTLSKLTEEIIEYSLTHQTPSIILFSKDEDSEHTSLLKELVQTRAKKYRVNFHLTKTQIIFVFSPNNTEMNQKFLDFYNIEELPTLVALSSDYETNSFHKFRFNYPLVNEENLDAWIADLLSSNYKFSLR